MTEPTITTSLELNLTFEAIAALGWRRNADGYHEFVGDTDEGAAAIRDFVGDRLEEHRTRHWPNAWKPDDQPASPVPSRRRRDEPLSRDEERRLALRVAAGDPHARAEFIEANVRLAQSIAWRYMAGGDPEVFSAAYSGLIQAVDRFDVQRDCRFSTYATRRVRGAVLDYLRKRRRIASKEQSVEIGEARLSALADPEPLEPALASPDSVDGARTDAIKRTRRSEALVRFASLVVDDLRAQLLTDRERQVFFCHFDSARTLVETAVILNISTRQVELARNRGLAKLREELANRYGMIGGNDDIAALLERALAVAANRGQAA